jgi:hypothetical protein
LFKRECSAADSPPYLRRRANDLGADRRPHIPTAENRLRKREPLRTITQLFWVGKSILGSIQRQEPAMPKFVIEREIPGVGNLTPAELQGVAEKSCSVLRGLPKVQWLESYVTDNKIYCVYIAPDEAAVREHARLGGFPANSVAVIRHIIDPTSAEAPPR